MPAREISSEEDVDVGRHGLIVEQGARRGLLLPQVAVEHRWSRVSFLEHTCLKAGLPPEAWRSDARVFVFEAQVFGERGYRASGMGVGDQGSGIRGRGSAPTP
jgi:uncharacterized protein (TIGR00296 family)